MPSYCLLDDFLQSTQFKKKSGQRIAVSREEPKVQNRNEANIKDRVEVLDYFLK